MTNCIKGAEIIKKFIEIYSKKVKKRAYRAVCIAGGFRMDSKTGDVLRQKSSKHFNLFLNKQKQESKAGYFRIIRSRKFVRKDLIELVKEAPRRSQAAGSLVSGRDQESKNHRKNSARSNLYNLHQQYRINRFGGAKTKLKALRKLSAASNCNKNLNNSSNLLNNNKSVVSELPEMADDLSQFTVSIVTDHTKITRKVHSRRDVSGTRSLSVLHRSQVKKTESVNPAFSVVPVKENVSEDAVAKSINGEPKKNEALETTYIQSIKNMSNLMNNRLSGDYCIRSKRTQINQYVIMKKIGKGGWSKVLLGVDVIHKKKYVCLEGVFEDFLFCFRFVW